MAEECDEDHYFLDNISCEKCRKWFSSGSVVIKDRQFVSGICDECSVTSKKDGLRFNKTAELQADYSIGVSTMQNARIAAGCCGILLGAAVFNLLPDISRGFVGIISAVALFLSGGWFLLGRDRSEQAKAQLDLMAK